MSTTEVAKRIPKTLSGEPWRGPARYQVFVEVAPKPSPDGSKNVDVYVGRVGVTNDPKKIAGIIADDIVAMRDTFGGLIEPTSTKGRTYRVFEIAAAELDTMQILRDSDYALKPDAPVTIKPKKAKRK